MAAVCQQQLCPGHLGSHLRLRSRYSAKRISGLTHHHGLPTRLGMIKREIGIGAGIRKGRDVTSPCGAAGGAGSAGVSVGFSVE
jgi:hypothetical protein